jgi:hypothetical protein
MTLHDDPALAAAAPTTLDDPRERAPSSLHRSLAVRCLMPGGRNPRQVHAIFRPETMALYTALGLDPREPLVVARSEPRGQCVHSLNGSACLSAAPVAAAA